jgi:hypothetical protein
MSNSQQTYQQAMHNLSVANMLREENKITLLMCKPRGRKGVLSALDLFNVHYESRVGKIKYDDEAEPLDNLKYDVAHALLTYMVRDLKIPYTSINYDKFVVEIERSFWNSENWNMYPVELAEMYEDSHICNYIDEFRYFFEINKEMQAFKYILDVIKRI